MSVCPMRKQDRIISSLQDFLYSSFLSPISAFIVWSLLCGVLFHLNCHLFWVKLFISILKSVYGILKLLSMGIFQAVLAVESAWSFPLILEWLGIQHSSIFLIGFLVYSIFAWLGDYPGFGFLVGWLFGFYGTSTFVGYLMPNPFLYK